MSYQLDTVYVISLGILVGLIIVPARDWINGLLAARGRKVHSFVWGWFAMLVSMAAVVPILLAKGAAWDRRLIIAAYTEGLPVGAASIVAYDLGIKPLRKFLTKAISRWILTSLDKGGMYGAYGGESLGMGEEELEDGLGRHPNPAPSEFMGGESGDTPAGPP